MKEFCKIRKLLKHLLLPKYSKLLTKEFNPMLNCTMSLYWIREIEKLSLQLWKSTLNFKIFTNWIKYHFISLEGLLYILHKFLLWESKRSFMASKFTCYGPPCWTQSLMLITYGSQSKYSVWHTHTNEQPWLFIYSSFQSKWKMPFSFPIPSFSPVVHRHELTRFE